MIDVQKLERLARHAHWRFGPNGASLWSGRRRCVRRGQGIAFSGHREYEYGDDLRHIDWKVTARLARPFVKVFEQEQAGTLILAMDASASMRNEPSATAPSTARDPKDASAAVPMKLPNLRKNWRRVSYLT